MNIAHICPRLKFPGGTEEFVTKVHKIMTMEGIKSRIYSIDFDGRPALLSDVVMSAALASRATRDGFDVLIFHQGQAAATLSRGVKSVCYFHQIKYDDLSGEGLVHLLYRNFLTAMERRLTRIVCNSRYAATRIGAIFPSASVDVVYPGVLMPSESKAISENFQFCYYNSRIHPRKNQEFLLRVFEDLPHKLVLTGGTWDRRFRNYQTRLIQKASCMSNVEVSTNISSKVRDNFLSNSLLFCFPAKDETFGIALLEAMAYGRPVIALDSGATSEVMGGEGIMCGTDIEEWRNAISKLASDRDLRRSLSVRSLGRAKDFTWEHTTKKLLQIIEED